MSPRKSYGKPGWWWPEQGLQHGPRGKSVAEANMSLTKVYTASGEGKLR